MDVRLVFEIDASVMHYRGTVETYQQTKAAKHAASISVIETAIFLFVMKTVLPGALWSRGLQRPRLIAENHLCGMNAVCISVFCVFLRRNKYLVSRTTHLN